MQGNILADFYFEAMKRQLRRRGKVASMEQAEDLGKIKKDRIPGHRPEGILRLPGVQSVAFAQLDFGTPSVKPTRFLMRTQGPFHPEMYERPPTI